MTATAARALEQELLDLERQYWRALQSRDSATLERLTDFPCIVTGPQGVANIDRPTFAKMLKDSRYTINNFKLSDFQLRFLHDDVAVVAYKVQQDLTVDGKPVRMDAADLSTWIRRDGQWVCGAHAEGILGDSFGRDRQRTQSD